MDVSVIIVNYNTRQLLADCLHSIYVRTKGVEFEVIVSDNGSTDGSVEMLKAEFPQVVLIENNANLGFGKANNVAAKLARGKYLFFLNSDTVLLNNAIKAFFDFAESQHEPCILGGWLMDAQKQPMPSYGQFTSFWKQLFGYLYDYFPFLLKIRLFLHPRKSAVVRSNAVCVDFVTGADLFISASIFNAIEGFDESFFMYHEDDDLCRRSAEQGSKSFLISAPQIVHLEGKSSKNSARKMMIREKSFLYYISKYTSNLRFTMYRHVYRLFVVLRFLSPVFSLAEKQELFINTKKLLKEYFL